jgi:hypothetical protein
MLDVYAVPDVSGKGYCLSLAPPTARLEIERCGCRRAIGDMSVVAAK